MQLVIAEKPSVGMALAKALGVTEKKDGYIEGNGYIVSWCVGHLVSLANADMYDEKFKKWDIADLPIIPDEWQFIIAEDKDKQFGILRQLILKAAEPYDRKQLADKLWYLHQDVEVEYFIPDYFFTGGFDVSTDKISEALQGEKPVQEMIDGMKDLMKQYEADRDVLRFHFHDLPEMLEKLKDRQLERTKFTAEPSFTIKHKYFITDDEKNKLVASGSNVVGGKKRIAKFFKEPHTAKEKADFLKNEYGIGGSGRSGYNTWHDSKGLVLTKGDLSKPDAQVTMKWNEVAERVSKLVAQNRFITQKDIDDEIRYAKRVIANASDNPLEEQSIKQAKAVLEEYGVELEEKSVPAPKLTEETVSEAAEEIEEYNDDDEIKLKVGDKIELDDGVFEITEISDSIDDTKYQLRDLGSIYPIFRVMYETEIYENGFALVDEAPAKESIINEPAPNISEVPELNGEKHDFTITDENLGVGGAKSKFKANVEAIKLLNKLEFENRRATPEEQEILSRYVGWGGLAQAFDENNSAWSSEFTELYTLLSPDEYESAKASTLNAHYTSPTVINAMYEGLENLGFKGGNVLEPAMGVGNFFGVMPEEMRNSKLYGVELDSISGRIAKQLYQNADIQVTGFEKTSFPDNFFDVAICFTPRSDFLGR